MSETYRITRKYLDNSHPDHNEVIRTGLTLEEAQEHCNDPSTHEKGVWFDCYYEENHRSPLPSEVGLSRALHLRHGWVRQR